MFSYVMHSPYRFLLAAGLIAALLCLFPARVDAPQETRPLHAGAGAASAPPPVLDAPANADFSEQTAPGCSLHRTLYYAPCGHSVQRREKLPAKLCGLTRKALESEIGDVIEGAAVTGFSSSEVDIAQSLQIPCPMHWVLAGGEDGMLAILQNRMGEELEVVRRTDVPLKQAAAQEQEALREGRIFDDVQALEGYLESLSS